MRLPLPLTVLTPKTWTMRCISRSLKNGNLELGVHIADVSYYVTEGSALDKEALNRATSVYVTDRVVPMLPERLSMVSAPSILKLIA